jgi:uncharacterized delta-60 repeat protein
MTKRGLRLLAAGAGLLLGLCGVPAAFAAPGDLDPSFGFGGVVTTDVGRDDYGGDVAVDAAGRTVVVGSSETFTVDQSSMAVARYTKSGMPDTSFGGDGLVTLNLGPQTIDFGQAVAVDANGRILIVGASCPSTSECFDVLGIRLTSSGQLDPSFGGGDGIAPMADAVSDVIIDPSGRIVVTGSHDGDLAVFRLTPDGALDPGFGGDGIATADFAGYSYSYGYGLALDSQGRLVVGGEAAGESEADFAVARFSSGGALDPSFGGDGRVATDLDSLGRLDYLRGMVVDSADRVYAVGTSFPSSPGDPWHPALVRYVASGSVDATFGAGGVVFGEAHASAHAVAIDRNERPLVAISENDGGVLRRYLSDGAPDAAFGGGDGSAAMPIGIQESLTVDPWRRIVVAGSDWNGSDSDFATARFTSGEPLPPSRMLTVSVGGAGHVTGPGIACPSDCSETYASGAPIALLATPSPGFSFAGWSGSCSGTGACDLALSADAAVTATFAAQPGSSPSGSAAAPPPSAATPPPSTAAPPGPAKPPVPRKCRKGLKKRKVRGRTKCVKARPVAHRRRGRRPARRG